MGSKVEIGVISLEKEQLKEGAKHIFLYDIMSGPVNFQDILDSLEALNIGEFILLPIPPSKFRAYEISKEKSNGQ